MVHDRIAVSSVAPLISASGISKRYENQAGVDNVSLSIAPGEVVTLIGPNGAGKTTLLLLLLGVIAPDVGSVTRAPNLRIGYLPQHFPLQPALPLTVEGVMRLSKGEKQGARMAQVLEEMGIAHLRSRAFATLSGGERQRALMARALLADPQLLVLDEPVQGVDVAGQAELYRHIHALAARRGAAVLMVSHDLFVVMAATSRVICLNRHICCEGSPTHVGAHPAFVSLFGSEVAGQLATYTHRHNHHHSLHGEVIAGVHSEACHHD